MIASLAALPFGVASLVWFGIREQRKPREHQGDATILVGFFIVGYFPVFVLASVCGL